jgi:cellobiose phosphorylase
LLTQEGSETFWDRSTLYALRGVFAAGETEKAVSYLSYYAHQRLIGDHVPYAIEAWPEGSQRHLSAESGLFCRVVTEGIFGIRPTGLHTFTITPRLPKGWPEMSLKNIHAFNSGFEIRVKREKDKIHVIINDSENKVIAEKLITDGASMDVNLRK